MDRQEENLIDLVADGSVGTLRARQRLNRLQADRNTLRSQLNGMEHELAFGAEAIETALQLLENCRDLYRLSGPNERRLVNQATFEKIYVSEDGVSQTRFTPPVRPMVRAVGLTGTQTHDDAQDRASGESEARVTNLLARIASAGGFY